MNKITSFFSEAYQELRYKVSWPTWAELQSSTQLVLVAFLLISVVVFAMDLASKELLDLFYGRF
jgi:preprotein translocase subunit SecE